MNCVVLLFSKDRALQLDAALRSFLFHCRDAESVQIRVLYATSAPLHTEQYKRLEEEYRRYPLIQFVSEKDFRSDVLSILAPFDYTFFLVDDNIFVRDFALAEIIECLRNHQAALGFSLRLGKNTTYCYTQNKQQSLPDFIDIGNKVLLHDWTHAEYDFGYPLEVSSSGYRTDDILPFIAKLPFTNPSTLEAEMANNKSAFQKEKPFLLCYEQSVAFCAPMNIVQTAWPNRVSPKIEYSPENLAQLFSEGSRIDISAYTNFMPNACHQEVELKFIGGKGQGSAPSVAQQPSISIIILNYNGLEDIKACLDSIRRNTPEGHEIIVVDNASTDGSVEYLRSLHDLTLIENKTNIGCPPARAQAMSLAKGKYIIFLDNDTIVTNGWTTKFIEHARAHPEIGLIGPHSNYVSGMQLVPEVHYTSTDELEKFAGDFSRQYQGQLTPTLRLVGFCIFIRREVVDRIGSIDSSFGKFGFEDDDYTWRAFIAGFKAAIANDIFIHHTGGPQGRGDSNYNQLLLDAWEIFKKKWGLPIDLQYGTHCSPEMLYGILSQPFDLLKHYIELPGRSTVENLAYDSRGSKEMGTEKTFAGKSSDDVPILPIKDMVSIVIQVSKRHENIKECIESIKKNTPQQHEIILAPVGSSQGATDYLRSLLTKNRNCRIIDYGSALTYPAACNRGIIDSSGEYIVLISDDVVVTEGWIDSMLEHVNSSPDVGIMSPMTINVDGPQGVKDVDYDSVTHLDEYAGNFREKYRHRRIEAINLNGFCMLFKKELIKKIGTMDERLDIADFADNDYCLRAAAEGYTNLIAGDVFVHSLRNRTLADRDKDFMGDLPRISKLFFEKWNSLDAASPLGKKIYVLNVLTAAHELSQKGQKAEAIRVLLESKSVSPENAKIYYSLAGVMIENREFTGAFELLENMPESLKKDSVRFELMAYCKISLNELAMALQFADKALSLNSASPKALDIKGTVAVKKGDTKEAESFFLKAIDTDKGYGKSFANLGTLKWEGGDKEEAFKLFERGFVLSPEDEDVIDKYHDAVISLSRFDNAAVLMDEAANVYPFHKGLKYALADIFLKQGKNSKAMSLLEDILLECGIDDEILSFALKIREKTGPKKIATPPRATRNDRQRTSISLCMIVKNEEKNMARCLRKIEPVVDEMIVVDTGSSDRTKDIAAAFGAKVFDFNWTNNFSDARNFSLSKASGRWILVLDADEVISPSDHEALIQLATKSGGKAAYSFVTRTYIYPVSIDWSPNDGKYLKEEAGTGWFPSEKVRLFPNNARIRFSNPVHELVESSIKKAGIKINKIGIPIHHYGKLDRGKTESKRTGYYELGKTKLAEKGNQDIPALFELATQTSKLGKHEEALGYWQKLTETSPSFVNGFMGLATAYFDLEKYEEAVSALRKAMDLTPGARDLITLYAICEACAGNFETAIPHLEKLLKKDSMHPLALGLLAAAFFCSNRKKEGFDRAKTLEKTNIDASMFFLSFAKSLLNARQYDYATALLEASIEGNYVTNETQALLYEAKAGRKGKSNPDESLKLDKSQQIPTSPNESHPFAGLAMEDDDLLLSIGNMITKLSESGSKISLVVLTSGESRYIEECIRAIKKFTPEPHEVILVPKGPSGGPDNWLAEFIKDNSNYRVVEPNPLKSRQGELEKIIPQSPILQKESVSYATACNLGINASTGDYIVLLNDDVIVTEGWLTGLLECAMCVPDAGLIGPMMDNTEGPQNVLQINYTTIENLNDFARSFRRRNRYSRTGFKKLQDSCLLLSRGFFEKMGSFDEKLASSEYAVEDYCLRASMEGHKNLISGDVFVHYRKDKSILHLRNYTLEHNKSLFSDKKIFIEKWSSIDIDSVQGQNLCAVNALNLADELSQTGQAQKALAALLEGIKYAPEHRSLHFALAECLIEESNFGEAAEILEKMPEALKQDSERLELLGYCKAGLRLYEEAERYADEVISSNRSSKKTWNLKGLIAHGRSFPDKAEKFFRQALELDKSAGETYANLGAIEWDRGQREKALDLFERAVILSPLSGSVVINYHSAAVSLSQLKRAEKTLTDLAAIFPLNRRLKYVLVDILLQEEKYQDAMTVLAKAMLAFGIDDETLSLSLGIREKIGPQEKTKVSAENISWKPGTPEFSNPVSVSLCMIVKNEEKNLANCLHSIASFADEMIVVDTGSTDRTKDIAKAFGAKVFDFAWTNDFSEARNYSLSKASCRWILTLDADEIIAPLDQDILRELLSDPGCKSTAFTIETRNYVVPVSAIGWKANDGSYIKEETGTGWCPSEKVRLFPNNPHIRFLFPVHEFVESSIKEVGMRNVKIDIPVHHYGKLHGEKIQSKGEDYYIMGKMKLSQKGGNDFQSLYELAIQAAELEKFDEALDYWKKVSEMKPDFPEAFFGMAISHYRLGRYEDAFNSLEKALQIGNDNPKQRETIILYAGCALRLGKAEFSIPLLEKILQEDPEFPMGLMMLGLSYCVTNNRATGKRYLEKLRGMRLNFQNHLIELLNFLLSAGKYSYALAIIETVMEIDKSDPRLSELLTKCMEMMNLGAAGK